MRSGFLLRKDQEQDMTWLASEQTTRQFDYDMVEIALHRRKDKWGYKRIMDFLDLLQECEDEFKPILHPEDPLCDYQREQLDRELQEIADGHQKIVPCQKRYCWVKKPQYNKKYKKVKR